MDQKLPFHSLKFVFGEKFLRRFSGSFVAKPENGTTDILDDVIIIDTPGTLDGSGEDRDYDFPEVRVTGTDSNYESEKFCLVFLFVPDEVLSRVLIVWCVRLRNAEFETITHSIIGYGMVCTKSNSHPPLF